MVDVITRWRTSLVTKNHCCYSEYGFCIGECKHPGLARFELFSPQYLIGYRLEHVRAASQSVLAHRIIHTPQISFLFKSSDWR